MSYVGVDLLGAYNSGNSSLEKWYFGYSTNPLYGAKCHIPAINAIDKNDVHKQWFQTDDTKIAPPPEVETSHFSKPFLVTSNVWNFNLFSY